MGEPFWLAERIGSFLILEQDTAASTSGLATADLARSLPRKVYTAERRSLLLGDLLELWRHRDLLLLLAERDVKIRYKQSLLGVAWAILQPLSLTIIFTIVFSVFLHVSTGGAAYPVFSYIAMLPWTFFANSITFGTSSLINNSSLLTKIYFPREVFPVASMLACSFDLLMGAVIAVGMMVFYHVGVSWWALSVPLILLVQMVFSGTVAMILSALMVFYRDLRFVVPLLMQLWMYATPIIYPVSKVPANLRGIYSLNPMVGLVESYRNVILNGTAPDWSLLGVSLAVSLILLFFGYRYFKRAEMRFADVV